MLTSKYHGALKHFYLEDIQDTLNKALGLPQQKSSSAFLPQDQDFIYPADRST